MIHLFGRIFIVVLLMTACKSKNREAADEIFKKIPSTKNLNAGNANYTLDIPKNWTSENSMYNGIKIYFLKAPNTGEDQNTSINLITEFMQNLDLDSYREKSMASLTKAVPTAKIIDTGSVNAHGLKGLWYSYTMQPNGDGAFLIDYIYPKDGIAYSITAGTQIRDSTKYRQTFDRVAKSFRFD